MNLQNRCSLACSRCCCTWAEWIEQLHLKRLEINHISGDHRELVHLGKCGNHRVLVERVGLAMHQPGPAPEGRAIHRENVERVAYLIEPSLDLMGFGGILFASELDPGLNLADGHAGEMEIGVGDALKPSQYGAMGARPASFRHHIGVE